MKHKKYKKGQADSAEENTGMRLNKYIAHAGICSRRKADEYIQEGLVKVNNTVVKEMGYKVMQGDKVTYNGKPVAPERKVYLIMNKPKGYVTTLSDEKGRKTVYDIVKKATEYRIYPVGRLDINTTGLLMLTNDGDLAQKLSHPSHEIEKVYSVTLDKDLTIAHFEDILKGLILEDGPIHIDELAWPDPSDKSMLGISLHSGRNRIVRRIFEHLGYNVKKLDRVLFAGLTKKDLPRGRFRHLKPHEVIRLKHFLKP